MNTDFSDERINEITQRTIGAAFEVSNELGTGFLEKVYENALVVELRMRGSHVATQSAVRVIYRNHNVGEYVADMIVDRCVLVEVKHVTTLDKVHTAQCLNYLRATALPICLLLNFGRPKLEIKRIAGVSK